MFYHLKYNNQKDCFFSCCGNEISLISFILFLNCSKETLSCKSKFNANCFSKNDQFFSSKFKLIFKYFK